MMLPTVAIPTKNEALNLSLCLASIIAYPNVYIIDSGSTDNTLEIAKTYGRPVINFKWNGHYPKKRNWFLESHQFKDDWVLFLDADERVTTKFTEEISILLPGTSHDAFWIRYDNWFMGKLLKHGDPMRKLALLRVGHGKYERVEENCWSNLDMEVHEHLRVEGTEGNIQARLKHYDMRNLKSYYDKHNEYSSWEASRYLAIKNALNEKLLLPRQRIKYALITNWSFPLIYFLVAYIFRRGFLDGRIGLMFNLSKMFYFYQIQFKIKEIIMRRVV